MNYQDEFERILAHALQHQELAALQKALRWLNVEAYPEKKARDEEKLAEYQRKAKRLEDNLEVKQKKWRALFESATAFKDVFRGGRALRAALIPSKGKTERWIVLDPYDALGRLRPHGAVSYVEVRAERDPHSGKVWKTSPVGYEEEEAPRANRFDEFYKQRAHRPRDAARVAELRRTIQANHPDRGGDPELARRAIEELRGMRRT